MFKTKGGSKAVWTMLKRLHYWYGTASLILLRNSVQTSRGSKTIFVSGCWTCTGWKKTEQLIPGRDCWKGRTRLPTLSLLQLRIRWSIEPGLKKMPNNDESKDHMAPVVAFATRGYHILVEKPMAVTEEDCRCAWNRHCVLNIFDWLSSDISNVIT